MNGLQVVDGRVRRDALHVRVRRYGEVIWQGKIRHLRQGKNDTDQVGSGVECGIMFHDWEDFQIGDKVEVVELISRQPRVKSTDTGAVVIDE